ncbi:MAG: hypothetical protein OXB84_04640, partial [Halobacteriovoraceae bacterium]|nr:hypothetical protein [Halobacteriovoraceae bacterium]
MKDDFFFLHKSFDDFNPPVEVVLVQVTLSFKRELISILEQKLNITVRDYQSCEDCLKKLNLENSHFCLIMEDLPDKEMDAFTLINLLKEEYPGFSSIILQNTPKQRPVVQISNTHYSVHPFSLEKIFSLFNRALQEDLGVIESVDTSILPPDLLLKNHLQGMIGGSKAMQDIFEKVRKN